LSLQFFENILNHQDLVWFQQVLQNNGTEKIINYNVQACINQQRDT
jgi:hypothetical protein